MNSSVPDVSLIGSKISPGSFGYLNGLSNPINFSANWNVFVVNMLTLSRNILGLFPKNDATNVHTEVLIDHLKDDMDMILVYIKKYIENSVNYDSTSNSNFRVIFYFPHYNILRGLNPETYKQPTKATASAEDVYERIYRVMKKNTIGKYNTLEKEDSLVYYTFLKPELYSSVALYRILLRGLSFPKKPLLITHIPMDYFLLKFIPNTQSMDSFTGKILDIKDTFSQKLFKSPSIPFSKYMLYLFGDKYLVKSHLPRGMRTKLSIVAKDEKWYLLSDDQLKSKLIEKELINNDKYTFHPY